MLKFSLTNNLLDVPKFKKPEDIQTYFENEFGEVSREVFEFDKPDVIKYRPDESEDDVFALATLLTNGETTDHNSTLQSDIITYNEQPYKILLEEPTPSNIPSYLINSFGKQALIFCMQRKSVYGETGNERFNIIKSYTAQSFEKCKEEYILRQTAANLRKHRFNLNVQ